MIAYPDTSLLVAAFVNEAHSARAQDWLLAQDVEGVIVSDWTLVEFASAIGLKARRGDLEAAQHRAIASEFETFASRTKVIFAGHPALARARGYLDTPALGLRSGDALQISLAVGAAAVLWTLDIGQCRAAKALGLDVEMP